DFYNYVNGNWMKTAVIPSDKPTWGSFNQLAENTDVNSLKVLKESLNQQYAKGSDGQKIADLYRSFVDFDARNKLGLAPIQQRLKDIDAIQNLNQLYAYFVKYAEVGGN